MTHGLQHVPRLTDCLIPHPIKALLRWKERPDYVFHNCWDVSVSSKQTNKKVILRKVFLVQHMVELSSHTTSRWGVRGWSVRFDSLAPIFVQPNKYHQHHNGASLQFASAQLNQTCTWATVSYRLGSASSFLDWDGAQSQSRRRSIRNWKMSQYRQWIDVSWFLYTLTNPAVR